ncbi:MAG: hypothetical protein ACKORL_04295 [Phycisphaerales bacterium]
MLVVAVMIAVIAGLAIDLSGTGTMSSGLPPRDGAPPSVKPVTRSSAWS